MKKQLFKYTLLYGSLAAIACLLFFAGLYFISPNPLGVRRPDIGFNIILIFLAQYFYKKNNAGYLHFYEGVSIGFCVNLFASVVTGIGIFIFVEFIDKMPFTAWIDNGVKLLYDQKATFDVLLSPENFERQVQSLKSARTYQLILDEVMFKTFCIIPITLVSIALRSQRPN